MQQRPEQALQPQDVRPGHEARPFICFSILAAGVCGAGLQPGLEGVGAHFAVGGALVGVGRGFAGLGEEAGGGGGVVEYAGGGVGGGGGG